MRTFQKTRVLPQQHKPKRRIKMMIQIEEVTREEGRKEEEGEEEEEEEEEKRKRKRKRGRGRGKEEEVQGQQLSTTRPS